MALRALIVRQNSLLSSGGSAPTSPRSGSHPGSPGTPVLVRSVLNVHNAPHVLPTTKSALKGLAEGHDRIGAVIEQYERSMLRAEATETLLSRLPPPPPPLPALDANAGGQAVPTHPPPLRASASSPALMGAAVSRGKSRFAAGGDDGVIDETAARDAVAAASGGGGGGAGSGKLSAAAAALAAGRVLARAANARIGCLSSAVPLSQRNARSLSVKTVSLMSTGGGVPPAAPAPVPAALRGTNRASSEPGSALAAPAPAAGATRTALLLARAGPPPARHATIADAADLLGPRTPLAPLLPPLRPAAPQASSAAGSASPSTSAHTPSSVQSSPASPAARSYGGFGACPKLARHSAPGGHATASDESPLWQVPVLSAAAAAVGASPSALRCFRQHRRVTLA